MSLSKKYYFFSYDRCFMLQCFSLFLSEWSAPSAIGIAGLGGGFEIGIEVSGLSTPLPRSPKTAQTQHDVTKASLCPYVASYTCGRLLPSPSPLLFSLSLPFYELVCLWSLYKLLYIFKST